MKNQVIKSLKTFCVILLMAACHKDEVAQNSTMSFTMPNTNYSYWIVLSDQNGNVLVWKSVQPNVETSFSYPAKDSVNVTVIENYNATFYNLYTYTNVVAGNYAPQASSNNQSASNSIGNYTVEITDSSDYYNFDVVANNLYGYNGGTKDGVYTANLSFSGNSGLFVSLAKGDSTPRYYFKPEITFSDTTVINSNLYNTLPLMNSNTVLFSGNVLAWSLVEGNMSDGQSQLISFYELGELTTAQPIFYPDINQVGSFFKDYNVFLSYSYQSEPYTVYSYYQSAIDPSTFKSKELQVNLIGISSATISNVSYQLNGDALVSGLTLSNNKNASWNIYSKFSNKIDVALPKFPDDLKKEIDFSFLSTLSINGLGIYGSTGFGSYNDFYKARLVFSQTMSDSPNKVYGVKPDGTIGD